MSLRRRLAMLAAPLLGAGLLLGACAVENAPPTDVFYRLDIPQSEIVPAPVTDPRTVEVGRFDAKGTLGDRAIAFTTRTDGQVLEQYSYHFWEETPAILLRDQMVNYLRASGAFAEVVTPALRARADLLILGRVLRMEHVLPPEGESGPAVALSLELTLLDPQTDDVKVLATYTEVIPVADRTVPTATQGLRDALARILARFAKDITKS
ncbi:ABC-type transport auxiliary lipoprotein family protein [Rhodospirillum sp. A1_3_36]|uniref:ABC-type transport auxiliary lipoprotein family protein n=1 Tax=Rhodospirillum sp. A1_3_36 TaxID=3391666 RepID=UPI0039A6BBF2